MRKTVLSFILCLVAVTAHSQALSRFTFGAKGGIAVSTQNVDGRWNDTDYRVGLDAGLFAQYRIGFSTVLSMGVHYTQKGHEGIDGKFLDPGAADSTQTLSDFRIDYLHLPILLRIDMPVGQLPTYLIAGPHFAFQIGQPDAVDAFYGDSLQTFVLGGTVGFGHEWKVLARMSALIEVSYQHDFTEAFDVNGSKLRNRAFGVLVGVRFD